MPFFTSRFPMLFAFMRTCFTCLPASLLIAAIVVFLSDNGGATINTFEDDGSVHAVTLFDLAVDPGQTKDLAATRTADRDRLIAHLDAWNKTNAAPRALVAKGYRDNIGRKHKMDVIGRDAERKLP